MARNFKAFPFIQNEKNKNDFDFIFNSDQCRIFNSPNGILSNSIQINDCLSNDSVLRIKNRKIVIGISFISSVQLKSIKISLNNIFKLQENEELKQEKAILNQKIQQLTIKI